MDTISQREFRNNSGEIVRGLRAGKSYRLTSRGEPVGVVTPTSESDPLRGLVLRVGTQTMSFPEGVRRPESSQNALDDLRRDR